jgi:hypothetical protein
MYVKGKELVRAIGLVKGNIDPGVFFDAETLRSLSQRFDAKSEKWSQAYKARDAFSTDASAPFPAKPDFEDAVLVV